MVLCADVEQSDVSRVVCSPSGYLDHQGYDISPVQALIPKLQRLLAAFRNAGFPVYHTREGNLAILELTFGFAHSFRSSTGSIDALTS